MDANQRGCVEVARLELAFEKPEASSGKHQEASGRCYVSPMRLDGRIRFEKDLSGCMGRL